MNLFDLIPVLFVIAMTAATIGLGIQATRASKTASDFFVAGRSVSVFWNASAISGEYLSAASFMGVAGLIMKHGYDALWYPVGYAVGYLFLLLFIAGPLRRFGAYTIPDFAEGRFDSPTFRKVAVLFVLCIGFFYTMPQMRGAGLTMQTLLGWPYWAGIAVVGAVITFNVALGGMKGITLVQAFQYWAKAFAISLPVFILLAIFGGYGGKVGQNAADPGEAPKFTQERTLKFAGKDKAPANALAFSTLGETVVRFPSGANIDKITTARKPQLGEDPIVFDGGAANPDLFRAQPVVVTRNGQPVRVYGDYVVTAPKIEFAAPTEVTFEAGAYVPNSQTNGKWVQPYGTLTSKHGYPILYTYSLIIALVCGTAGLPHILVRFYTNPDGRAAKRTTLWVMVLLGVFYVFTPVWGALGRADLPMLYANNKTDAVVIALPQALQNKLLGQILVGITSAGAFAAFMSTFSGLLVSMSGALAHDVYGKILKPTASQKERLAAFKIAAVIIGVISIGLGLLVETFDITLLVGWAFAIAAASYFPLLLLGAWWRGLTKYGAAAGMLLGGTLSLAAIVTSMLLDTKVLTFAVSPIAKSLMEQPAIWGVPLSIALMVGISLATRRHVPGDVTLKMLRLHAPEEIGLQKDYVD
ncbi:MAG TPA: cation acetate symporter [Armatimonadaceae bacterium]|nr:cation acetate symporter [Armatimonadaceae bacterium]